MEPVCAIQPAPAPSAAQRIGRVLLASGLILLGLWILREFLAALAWAAVFAIALWPLYRRLCRATPARARRVLSPLLMTAIIALVFVVPFAYLAVALAREMHVVVDFVFEARRNGIPVPNWIPSLPVIGSSAASWWYTNLSDPGTAQDVIGRLDARTLAESARQYGGEIAHRLTLFVFTLLTLFFLFRDGEALAVQLLRVSDRVLGTRGERIARQMISAVHGTVDGLVLVGLAEGVLLGFVYAIVGLPHPVLIGALTGVLAVVPFGAPVIFGAAGLFLLAVGNTIAAAIVVAAGMVVVFVADHAVRPFLIGGAAKLPFIWVLLGILGGLQSFGFLGLFLGPAVMAALISLWREWCDPGPVVLGAAAEAAGPPLAGPAPAGSLPPQPRRHDPAVSA
ncbi:MAG: AI-2E family transporter [Alphaproteobacteria bacterium]|nr:AI-2E family transporter [Alphaproteobacteria bacterium]